MKRNADDLQRLIAELQDEQTYLLLDQLRAFRHVFRNLYARPIDSERIRLVQKKVPAGVQRFTQAIDQYITTLHRIQDRLTP